MSRYALLSIYILFAICSAKFSLAQEQPLNNFYLFEKETDERLAKKITVLTPSISFNDLIKDISTQTGVDITTEENDPISGSILSVSLNKQPAIEVMNGVLSLISFKGARAYVHPTLKNGKRTYVVRLKNCHDSAEALTKLGNETFKRQYDLLLKIAELEPSERKKHQSEVEKSMNLDQSHTLDAWFILNNKGVEAMWEHLRLFSQLTTETDREKIFAGIPLIIPTKDLQPEFVDHMYDILQSSKTTVLNGVTQNFEMTDILFTFETKSGSRKRLTPCLSFGSTSVTVGSSSYKFSGRAMFSIVGGADWDLAPVIQKNWILAGDMLHSNREDEAVPVKAAPLKEFDGASPLTLYASRSFGSVKIPYISLFPTDKSVQESRMPKSVRDGLKYLIGPQKVVMSKWRESGILLMNYADWFYGDDSSPSAAQISWIRKHIDPDGFLSLADLSSVLDAVPETQLKALQEEFPALIVQNDMRGITKLYLQQPKFTSVSGIILTPTVASYLIQFGVQPGVFPGPQSSVRLRTARRLDPEFKLQSFILFVDTKYGNGEWKERSKMTQFKFKKPPKSQVESASEEARHNIQ